jgi:hypothetical protein
MASDSSVESMPPSRVRFLADENLNLRIAEYLRKRHYNVRVATELRGHEDRDQLATAKREGRILLTHDADFLDRKKHPVHANPGVVVIPDDMRSVRILDEWLATPVVLDDSYTEIRSGGLIFITFRAFSSGRIETQRFRHDENGDMWVWDEE